MHLAQNLKRPNQTKKNRLIRRFFRLKTCLINLSEKVVIRQNFCLIKSSENWNQTNLSDKISVWQNRLTRGCQTIWSDNFKGFCLKQGFQTIYWRKLSDKFDANQASKETWWNQLNCGVHLDAPIQHACSSLIQMLPGLLVQKLPGLLRPDSDIARPSKACLLRPDSAFKNQEAPGPMKFFSGGVASNVCMPQPLISKP